MVEEEVYLSFTRWGEGIRERESILLRKMSTTLNFYKKFINRQKVHFYEANSKFSILKLVFSGQISQREISRQPLQLMLDECLAVEEEKILKSEL